MFIDGHLCGFNACINFPHPVVKNMRKEHRLVILPQFQGLGLGSILSEFCGKYYTKQGLRFRGTTTHPSLIYRRQKNPNWVFVNKKENKDQYEGDKISTRWAVGFRTTYTFEYQPQKNVDNFI